MAKQLLLTLLVLALGSYGFAKLSEEPSVTSVKVNIDVNSDQGSTHESVALVKEDGKWKALNDRKGGARQMSISSSLPGYLLPLLPGELSALGVQPAARSLNVKSRMFSTSFLGPVCTECGAQNSELFIKCLRKLWKEDSEYKRCFKQLLKRDENREDDKKCATCICKELQNSGVDGDAYREVRDMFCYLGNNLDYCSDGDETSENEHFPKCGEGLMCDTGDKTWGYCKIEKCDDTSKGAVDKLELNCNQYAGLDICDRSDELKDEDFEAKKMCCACGGGSVPKKEGTCTDGQQSKGETGIDCGGPCTACPTCNDGIQNQAEIDVDCGGTCNACPTCEDGIQNQGESSIDCGGPCNACSTCEDGIQNQGETGIDCGGPCVTNCQEGTCTDGQQSKGETGIDCGGPCTACPTCNDGIQNQGESSIDCGGPCNACSTCEDGIQNQGETGIDCGGPCVTNCQDLPQVDDQK